MSNRPRRKVLVALSLMATGVVLAFISSPRAQRRKHGLRRATFALSVLAVSLGLAFNSTLFAQRGAQRQQDSRPQVDTLKILTLDGRGGTKRSTNPQTGSRPRPLSAAQRFTLFKGRTDVNPLTLTANRPLVADKASIHFEDAKVVAADLGPTHPSYPPIGWASFVNSSAGQLGLTFRTKVGQLHALDFTVFTNSDASCTVTNLYTDVTQTTPVEGGSSRHITAYVTGEWDGYLLYSLKCSSEWTFYSVEITAL